MASGGLGRLSDEELVRRAARIDPAAFAELYDRHRTLSGRGAYLSRPLKNAADAPLSGTPGGYRGCSGLQVSARLERISAGLVFSP